MKVFYSAYTCQGNIGDLLITKFQIEEYAKYGEVYVDCFGMPSDFQQTIFSTQNPKIKNFVKEYGICYRSKNIFRVLRTLNKDGFTHFCSSPGPRDVLSLPLKKLAFKLLGNIIPRLMLKNSIKRYSLGVDLNYNPSGFLGWLNHWYFNEYDIIGVRSLKNYNSLKSKFKSIMYMPDMVFLYPSFTEEPFNETKNRVAFSFRKVDETNKLIEALKAVAETLGHQSADVDIIYQVEEDKDFCTQLHSLINLPNVHFSEDLVGFEQLSIYSQYDLVISNRLHVLLMAAMNGAIPYAVISKGENERKIADMFSGVFENNLVSYIDNFDRSIVIPIYNDMISVKKNAKRGLVKQRELCQKVFEDLLG